MPHLSSELPHNEFYGGGGEYYQPQNFEKLIKYNSFLWVSGTLIKLDRFINAKMRVQTQCHTFLILRPKKNKCFFTTRAPKHNCFEKKMV